MTAKEMEKFIKQQAEVMAKMQAEMDALKKGKVNTVPEIIIEGKETEDGYILLKVPKMAVTASFEGKNGKEMTVDYLFRGPLAWNNKPVGISIKGLDGVKCKLQIYKGND